MAATRSLGALTIDLIAKSGLWETGLDKAGRATQKLARDIDRQANSVQHSFDRAFTAIGVAAGSAFAAVGLAVRSSIKDMYDLVTRAKQVAMPIDQFSAYASAAGDAEVGIDSFSTALRKLDQSLAMAKQGSAQSLNAFKAIGIDPTKISTTQQAFKALANSFAKYRDDAGKVAIAQQLLGRGGTEMIAFLNQGSAAIDKLAAHQRELGVAFDADGAKKLQAYDDAMDEFHGTIKGLSNTLALEFLPVVTDATQKVTEFIQSWKDTGGMDKFMSALKTLLSNLDAIAAFFATRFIAARAVAGFVALGSAATAAGTAVGVLKVALAAVGGLPGIIATALASFVAVVVKYGDKTKDAATATGDLEKATRLLHQAQGDAIADALQLTKNREAEAQATLKSAQADLAKLEASRALFKQINDQIGEHRSADILVDTRTGSKVSDEIAQRRKDIAQLKKDIADAQKEITRQTPNAGKVTPITTGDKPAIKLFDPSAATKAADAVKKLRDSYDALVKAANGYANSVNPTPLDKANATMAESVANLTKLKDAYLAAGGSAQIANLFFDKALAGIKEKFTFDLTEPQRQLEKYTKSLDAQLDAMKEAHAVQMAGMSLSDREAANMADLARDTEDATKQISDFIAAHQLMNGQLSADDQKQLDALKTFLSARHDFISKSQADEEAMRGDWLAGMRKGMANFIDDQKNLYLQAQQFTENFASGFSNAFEEFASGAKSAKDAFGDFIDQLYAQALKFVANQAIMKLFDLLGGTHKQTFDAGSLTSGFNIGGGSGSAGGGFWGTVGTFLSSMFGRANGGPVTAGGMYRVNEMGGAEMLSIGRNDYLMMGSRGGYVTPASRTTGQGGNTFITNVQPTTTRRTADQVAQAVARTQRLAVSRG